MSPRDEQQSARVDAANPALEVTQRERALLARAPNVARDGERVRAEANSGDTSAAMLTSWEIGQSIGYDPLLADEETAEKVAVRRANETAIDQED